MSENDNSINDIQSIEKAIKASEGLRQKASASKGIYEQQLKETDEELKALGTTAEKGKAEIDEIAKEIQDKKDKINSLIPYDLLKQYNVLKD